MTNAYGVSLAAFEGRHQSVERLRRLFEYDHLPPHLQDVSMTFAAMAVKFLDDLTDSPELVESLRKLWEVKNLIVLQHARPAAG